MIDKGLAATIEQYPLDDSIEVDSTKKLNVLEAKLLFLDLPEIVSLMNEYRTQVGALTESLPSPATLEHYIETGKRQCDPGVIKQMSDELSETRNRIYIDLGSVYRGKGL
jgi:hypothetical protein